MSKTILCYGDSNTWGYVPVRDRNQPVARYDHQTRWPRRLQHLLGQDYYVVEEGLNGRTTNLNYHIPPDRNGKTHLPACLYSHAPLDLVVLALGGNDLKLYYGRQPEDICHGMAELIDIVQTSPYGKDMISPPEILLIGLGRPLPIAEHIVDDNGICLYKDSIRRVEKLNVLYRELAAAKNSHFLDLTGQVEPSPIDGLHLDEEGHRRVAECVGRTIRAIL